MINFTNQMIMIMQRQKRFLISVLVLFAIMYFIRKRNISKRQFGCMHKNISILPSERNSDFYHFSNFDFNEFSKFSRELLDSFKDENGIELNKKVSLSKVHKICVNFLEKHIASEEFLDTTSCYCVNDKFKQTLAKSPLHACSHDNEVKISVIEAIVSVSCFLNCPVDQKVDYLCNLCPKLEKEAMVELFGSLVRMGYINVNKHGFDKNERAEEIIFNNLLSSNVILKLSESGLYSLTT